MYKVSRHFHGAVSASAARSYSELSERGLPGHGELLSRALRASASRLGEKNASCRLESEVATPSLTAQPAKLSSGLRRNCCWRVGAARGIVLPHSM
jgi:hypothetical protein